jgi:hypothetical protein
MMYLGLTQNNTEWVDFHLRKEWKQTKWVQAVESQKSGQDRGK